MRSVNPEMTQPAPPLMYKGHLQPPVNERLLASKTFLADEDPHRCLDFDTKIAQIEEYVSHIKAENLPHDEDLLHDVTIMVEVHRDWEARLKNSWVDKTCDESASIPPFSTRLVSIDTASLLEREREARGLANQMREDHAPFSFQRESDHSQFLQALRKDADTDSDTFDRSKNLLWMENCAYSWALEDPAYIPFWTHPTNGIPNTGIRHTDPQPWYRQTQSQKLLPAGKSREDRDGLPPYAIELEEKINQLLKRYSLPSGLSEREWSDLKQFLAAFEPHDVINMRTRYIDSCAEQALWPRPENSAAIEKAQEEYDQSLRDWLDSLGSEGVHFMVDDPSESKSEKPGVIYISDEVFKDARQNLRHEAQELLDSFIEEGRNELTSEQAEKLDLLLDTYFPENIYNPRKVSLKIDLQMQLLALGSAVRKSNGTSTEETGFYGWRKEKFLDLYVQWISTLPVPQPPKTNEDLDKDPQPATETSRINQTNNTFQGLADFTTKAERRGIQRAAIEIALNLLATNQEQHRPDHRFRIVDLPTPYQPPLSEVSLYLPLKPTETPLEQDTFEFTTKMFAYRRGKDVGYDVSRTHRVSQYPGQLQAPLNYKGPFTVSSEAELANLASKWSGRLAQVQAGMVDAVTRAPRPLMQQLVAKVLEGAETSRLGNSKAHALYDDVPFTQEDLDLLLEISGPSWNDEIQPYRDNAGASEKRKLNEFDKDVDEVKQNLPVWTPAPDASSDTNMDPDAAERFAQILYEPHVRSQKSISSQKLLQMINDRRVARAGATSTPHLWTESEGYRYLKKMYYTNRIQ